MATGSRRPSLADVEAALPRIAGGGALVWQNPDGEIEVLAERDPDPRQRGCATIIDLNAQPWQDFERDCGD